MALRHDGDGFRRHEPELSTRDVLAALMTGEDLEDLANLFPPRPGWMGDALCREYPEVNFYPALGESAQQALAVCRRCQVREECLSFALDHDERGVWGGTTAPERRRLRRERARKVDGGEGRSEPVAPLAGDVAPPAGDVSPPE